VQSRYWSPTPTPDPLPGGVFIQPRYECVEPLPGEEPGTGPDGKVCTWSAISACTEPGRDFAEYSRCDVVRTQRPYSPSPATLEPDPEDPRLQDTAFMGELGWVTEQVRACACVCCHSTEGAPAGPSDWYLEAGPIWTDSIGDEGVALLAGLVDSTSFGAFAPEDNHGFARDVTALPTTDSARMRAFFLEEYLRRGFSESDAATIPPFGGPLVSQAEYTPRSCAGSNGIAADGTIRFTGVARYLYVLEADAANPGVPPNLDTPEGTLWRVEVPEAGRPIRPGLRYGEVPEGAVQRFPADAPPAALQAGQTYYLYTLADVGLPLTRCLATVQAP
jgi:hypothetical protein